MRSSSISALADQTALNVAGVVAAASSLEFCPRSMRDAIGAAQSYIEARVDAQMPYTLTLEHEIAELHRRAAASSNATKSPPPPPSPPPPTTPLIATPADSGGGSGGSGARSRNLTIELSATRQLRPTHQVMGAGMSNYTHQSQQVCSRVIVFARIRSFIRAKSVRRSSSERSKQNKKTNICLRRKSYGNVTNCYFISAYFRRQIFLYYACSNYRLYLLTTFVRRRSLIFLISWLFCSRQLQKY